MDNLKQLVVDQDLLQVDALEWLEAEVLEVVSMEDQKSHLQQGQVSVFEYNQYVNESNLQPPPKLHWSLSSIHVAQSVIYQLAWIGSETQSKRNQLLKKQSFSLSDHQSKCQCEELLESEEMHQVPKVQVKQLAPKAPPSLLCQWLAQKAQPLLH